MALTMKKLASGRGDISIGDYEGGGFLGTILPHVLPLTIDRNNLFLPNIRKLHGYYCRGIVD